MAVSLPLLIILVAFVVDIANWFEHRRHLQLQADAGALAAAGDFVAGDLCNDAAIEATARQYSGELYNAQIGGTPPEEIHFALNSATWPNQPDGPFDQTVVEAPPCESAMIDVKLTETDLPLLFRVADLVTHVPFINTHARVQIFRKATQSGALPVGVPDNNPKAARATFIDERTGNVIASTALVRNGENGDLAIWDNQASPLPVDVNTDRIGVRIHLSGGSSTTCGDPLVSCYDAGSDNGIVHIRGYSMAGSGAQPNEPRARSVTLYNGTCSDPYFSSADAPCTVGVTAEVDFGTCTPVADVGAELTAVVGNQDVPLAFTGACDPTTNTSNWETATAAITLDPGDGPVEIELEWEEHIGSVNGENCTNGGNNPCQGSFGVVQRAFSASTSRSGPIGLAQVADPDGTFWLNSLEQCSAAQANCTYDLVVRIGVEQSLAQNAQSADEEPVRLRVFHEAGGNPSQNQSLDCDPVKPNLRTELREGCDPTYKRNEGTTCPSQAALWASAEPWDCVAIQTGGAVNQVWFGMNERVHGTAQPTSCVSPNNWGLFPNFPEEDPRIVPVFLTPFGTFQGSGGGVTVPVQDFGIFYLTGWAGQGGGQRSNVTCPGDDAAGSGEIVGHFIAYIDNINEGGAGEETCDPAQLGACVPVLTE